ncbi:hypothetical protein E4U34_004900 [Claviceps purpurea]|nr:hypothetical protein E4U37_001071 [Claviceps purpurea]KAG6231403.1 hypothetical protein E4U34_004900 [Claviceps purpurea]KAG6234341.1 hypothetical protein E4U26_003683 [Claviceps purpurea]
MTGICFSREGGLNRGKLPDPAQLDDAMDPNYESWKGAISDKLSINEDWFTTEMARVAYVCSRTKGKALRHLDATRAADGSRTLWTVSQILNHLDLIFLDPNRGSKARDAYSLLRVSHTEFQEFRTNFYELIHRGGISESLKEEFYKKLPQEFSFVPGALPFSVFALARVHEEIGSCSAAASASRARRGTLGSFL